MTPEERAKELVFGMGVCLAAGDSEKALALALEHIKEAIKDEREAIAQMVDAWTTSGGAGHVLVLVAKAIRERQ